MCAAAVSGELSLVVGYFRRSEHFEKAPWITRDPLAYPYHFSTLRGPLLSFETHILVQKSSLARRGYHV